ncbi:MAG: hypothetical protein ACYTG3_19605 [Planctomycetota bacterium]|jgi:hypothetical protein
MHRTFLLLASLAVAGVVRANDRAEVDRGADPVRVRGYDRVSHGSYISSGRPGTYDYCYADLLQYRTVSLLGVTRPLYALSQYAVSTGPGNSSSFTMRLDSTTVYWPHVGIAGGPSYTAWRQVWKPLRELLPGERPLTTDASGSEPVPVWSAWFVQSSEVSTQPLQVGSFSVQVRGVISHMHNLSGNLSLAQGAVAGEPVRALVRAMQTNNADLTILQSVSLGSDVQVRIDQSLPLMRERIPGSVAQATIEGGASGGMRIYRDPQHFLLRVTVTQGRSRLSYFPIYRVVRTFLDKQQAAEEVWLSEA